MARRASRFLKEFVVLFGFLNGVWLAVGVNPGREFLEVLQGIVETMFSGKLVGFLFTAIPVVLVLLALRFILRRGGWLGVVAVALAFVAGLNVVAAPRTMFALLVAALVLGWLATSR